jgi:hypothetical protein
MRRSRAARGDGKIGCVIWIAILALLGYGLYKFVPVKVSASRFEDFMNEEASFGSIKTVGQIEKEILARAHELELPINKDNLKITKSRELIVVEAHYEVVISLFGGSYLYTWKFDPVARRPLFAV